MASDASAALGAPQIAGSFVNPKGFAASVAARAAGGVVGSLAAEALASRSSSKQEDVPTFGRVGYVAVSADEIALVKTKSGLVKMKITEEVLARKQRSQITATTLDKGALK